jgi:predicted N-acetyltransferase YhbS
MDGGSGRCLCGAVRYAFTGAPLWQTHCHCESCRRATASGFTSFLSVPKARVTWTGTPRTYRSSVGVVRQFCGTCGTQMSYETVARPDDIDLYAATLDDPTLFRPEDHDQWNEHLPWIVPGDGLPRLSAPRAMGADEDFGPVLALIRQAFAYMDGVIDPPSSMHRLEVGDLAAAAATGEVWVIEDDAVPIATMTLDFSPNRVYLGKLAVAEPLRGRGLARALVRVARQQAEARGSPAVELQTRVELAGNHRAFQAMGFAEVGRSAHPGFDRPTSILFRLAVAPGQGTP